MSERMRALVLHQPYATLMAIGVKANETRSRKWSFTGDVAICASKPTPNALSNYSKAMGWLWQYRDKVGVYASNLSELYNALPFGKVVCVVAKTGCIGTEHIGGFGYPVSEIDCGDYAPGRFFYPTDHLRRLEHPVPVKGFQGVFFLPQSVGEMVRNQI